MSLALALIAFTAAHAQLADSFLSAAGQSCFTAKNQRGQLVWLNVDNASTSPLAICAYDTITTPTNGDATGRPIGVVSGAASSQDGQAPYNWTSPLPFSSGIIVCCSSTSCGSGLTKSANCQFSGGKQ